MMADDVRSDMENGFGKIHDRFARVDDEFAAVRAEIRKSAEDSRRYFQMLTEQIRDSVRLVAEGTAHNTSRLDSHETRLKTLEEPRRT